MNEKIENLRNRFAEEMGASTSKPLFDIVLKHLEEAFEEGGQAMSDQISEDMFGGVPNFKRQYVNPYNPEEEDN